MNRPVKIEPQTYKVEGVEGADIRQDVLAWLAFVLSILAVDIPF